MSDRAENTQVRDYDPDKVVCTVNGQVCTGFSDGDFIRASRREDQFAIAVGAYGSAVRTKNLDHSGTVLLRFLQTSPMVQTLRALEKQRSTFPVVCIDNNPDGDRGFTIDQASVLKPPDFLRGEGDQRTFEVTLITHNLVFK